jgi:class 3 adenylate cyclase
MVMSTLVAGIFAGVWLAIFVVAVRFRWFSRLRRGFLATLIAAIVGTGVFTTWLIGSWGYESAEKVLAEATSKALDNVGQVVEAEITGNIAVAHSQMQAAAYVLAPEINGKISEQARQKLHQIMQLNPRFMQMSLWDRNGNLALMLNQMSGSEPANRIMTAFCLEGKNFASDPYHSSIYDKYIMDLGVPIRSPEGEIRGVVAMRFSIEEGLSNLVKSTRFGDTGYAVLVGGDGHILAHPDPRRVHDDIGSYAAVQLALKGQQGLVTTTNKAGATRLFFYRPMKGPATINPGWLVLLTEMSRSEAEAPLRALRQKFLLGMGALAIACLVIAQQLSLYIKRPLQELVAIVEKIEQGDLTVQIRDLGKDTVGRLGNALNKMVHGLQERDKVKELFGRYVTTQVSDEVLKGQVVLGGESKRVTILFSDIRDFTTMSEKMAPSQVVSFLNDYFSEMVEAVFEQGGVLDKFMGDGMMAVFGSLGNAADHPRRAVMAALRMKALLAKINGERNVSGKPPIQIGIGIHTDDVIVGNIGSRKRLEYTVIGDGVNTSSRVQSLNKEFGTTILITETTYETVKDAFECRPMPAAQLKGKTKALQFYEVVSVKAA